MGADGATFRSTTPMCHVDPTSGGSRGAMIRVRERATRSPQLSTRGSYNPAMPSKIRVVVADDEPAYRNALQKTLHLMSECELMAVCKDGQEALDICLADPPDVLLTDINMPRLSGIELTRQLLKKEKQVAVVILTVAEDDDTVYD